MRYYATLNNISNRWGSASLLITWVDMFANDKKRYGRLVVGGKCSVVWCLSYCYARADVDKAGAKGYSNGTRIVLEYGAKYSLKYMCVLYCD